MIYIHNDVYSKLILKKVEGILGDNLVPLHNVYERIDDPEKDRPILNNLEIRVYELDREICTPHLHIIDNENNIDLVVSLIDYKILIFDISKNDCNDWDVFPDIKKRFFEWNKEYKNIEKAFKAWNDLNPGNELDNTYLLEKISGYWDINSDLEKFLEENENPLVLSFFRRELYTTMMLINCNEEKKKEFNGLDTIETLKKAEMFGKYGFTEKCTKALEVAEQVITDSKNWFSFI